MHAHIHTQWCAPDLWTEQMSSIFASKETNRRQQEVQSIVQLNGLRGRDGVAHL